jgi:hypothetical protein
MILAWQLFRFLVLLKNDTGKRQSLPRFNLWQVRLFSRDCDITPTSAAISLGYPSRIEPLATQDSVMTFAVNSPRFTANFANKAQFSRVVNTLASRHIEEM